MCVCVCVLACRLHLDRDETWKQELMNWCNAYTAYTKEYNQWLCMKVGTVRGGGGCGWAALIKTVTDVTTAGVVGL